MDRDCTAMTGHVDALDTKNPLALIRDISFVHIENTPNVSNVSSRKGLTAPSSFSATNVVLVVPLAARNHLTRDGYGEQKRPVTRLKWGQNYPSGGCDSIPDPPDQKRILGNIYTKRFSLPNSRSPHPSEPIHPEPPGNGLIR